MSLKVSVKRAMESKVSDFCISAYIIKTLCKRKGVSFVDVLVGFEDGSNGLNVGKTKNVFHTIYEIVKEYINRSQEIVGTELIDEVEKDNFLTILASNLRGFIYEDKYFPISYKYIHSLRLYQYPLVWLLMKDIVCPIYNLDLKNVKVVCGDVNQIDIARGYKEGEIEKDGEINDEFVFVNYLGNKVILNSFLFVEVLKLYELSPVDVLKDIYESDIYDKYKFLLEIALDEEEVGDFECTLMAVLGINFYDCILKVATSGRMKKIAQSIGVFPEAGPNNQFWMFGILEGMLEPTRGADWTVYKGLQPYVKEFWDKVEEVKQKRMAAGHDPGVPFDTLLRIKSQQTTGYKADPTKTLQALLSSDRIW